MKLGDIKDGEWLIRPGTPRCYQRIRSGGVIYPKDDSWVTIKPPGGHEEGFTRTMEVTRPPYVYIPGLGVGVKNPDETVTPLARLHTTSRYSGVVLLTLRYCNPGDQVLVTAYGSPQWGIVQPAANPDTQRIVKINGRDCLASLHASVLALIPASTPVTPETKPVADSSIKITVKSKPWTLGEAKPGTTVIGTATGNRYLVLEPRKPGEVTLINLSVPCEVQDSIDSTFYRPEKSVATAAKHEWKRDDLALYNGELIRVACVRSTRERADIAHCFHDRYVGSVEVSALTPVTVKEVIVE